MEPCRDEGEMVRGEGVGVGVLSAPDDLKLPADIDHGRPPAVIEVLRHHAEERVPAPEAAPAALRPAST